MNRRAQMTGFESDDDAATLGSWWLSIIVYIILVMPLAVLLYLAGHAYSGSFLTFSPQAEHELATERVMNCFGERDPVISRSYMVLDAELVDRERLGSCFFKSHTGVQVKLDDVATGSEIANVMVYTDVMPSKERQYPVAYRDLDGKVKRGVLKVAIS